jgi:filamentous hemagglutinin
MQGTVTASTFGLGLVFSSVAGLLSSSAGTNGQVVIGATGAAPLWGTITCPDGSVGIAIGANTIALTATGATASTFPTDAGVATPVAGATTITGGTNIGTAGAGGVVTINLDASPSVAGTLTAATGISSTAGNITASAGNLVATLGGVIAQTSVTATTGAITANAGNISATLGSVSAGTTVGAGTTITAGTGITSTLGNITSTAGNLVASAAGKGVVLGGGAKIVCGAGNPNGVVTAPVGSLYLNTTGSGVADRLFVNSDAATTWVAVTTVS